MSEADQLFLRRDAIYFFLSLDSDCLILELTKCLYFQIFMFAHSLVRISDKLYLKNVNPFKFIMNIFVLINAQN
jgi:hypothetical protein